MPRKFDPETMAPPAGLYHNAVEVLPGERLVFSSGIVGYREDGTLPDTAEEQIAQAWRNVGSFLDGVGMNAPDHLVRLTMRLTDRAHVTVSKEARIAALGAHMNAAVTGVICQLFYSELFIEIDVVAAG